MGFRERRALLRQIAAEQAALMLVDSGKTDSLLQHDGGFLPRIRPPKSPWRS